MEASGAAISEDKDLLENARFLQSQLDSVVASVERLIRTATK
jgi:hypothetical protein